jgi:hypothetical protein
VLSGNLVAKLHKVHQYGTQTTMEDRQ